MKLAEALILRSDLQTKLAAVEQRIAANVLVQEGEVPDENPERLIEEAIAINQALYDLIERIHRTNAQALMPDGQSLLAALNERDKLIGSHRIVQKAIDSANRENTRYSANEIRWVKTIKVKDLQSKADALAEQIRSKNIAIQAANWQLELA